MEVIFPFFFCHSLLKENMQVWYSDEPYEKQRQKLKLQRASSVRSGSLVPLICVRQLSKTNNLIQCSWTCIKTLFHWEITNRKVKGKMKTNITKIILKNYVEINVKSVLFFPLVLGNFISPTGNMD